MSELTKNFSVSTVATAPSPSTSGTSLVVATGEGARFPAAPFNAIVAPVDAQATPSNAEVVRVTAVASNTFTIARTQESSSARTIVAGDRIWAGPTAKTFADLEELMATPIPSQIILDSTAAWSTNAAANTEVLKDLDVDVVTAVNPGRLLAVIVKNPSTQSDLLCQVKWEWVDPNGGASRWAALSTPTGPSSFTVIHQGGTGADADGQVFLVDGGLLNAGGKLSLKNVTGGTLTAFTASVQVHALCAV